MRTSRLLCLAVVTVAITVFLAPAPVGLNAQQSAAVRIDNDDIGGVVTSANGPEAGVWVIAETTDLPTKYAKIVVTDDQGRYLFPICQKPITTSGCAAMGWSIRRKLKPLPARFST